MSWKHPLGEMCHTGGAWDVSACSYSLLNTIRLGLIVKHEGLTFDASQTPVYQPVPPSYGTTAGKHVVWQELLTTHAHRTRKGTYSRDNVSHPSASRRGLKERL